MRERLKSTITVVFCISLALFLLMGAAIVIVQLISVFLVNGAMSTAVNDILKLWSIRISVVAAFCGFIVPYLSAGKK